MDRPYNFSVSYKTKIVDVTSVNLFGKLCINMAGYEQDSYWEIIESGGNRRNLEEWLEKFEGRNVRIYIEVFDGVKDDAAMLEGEPPVPDNAEWQAANGMVR